MLRNGHYDYDKEEWCFTSLYDYKKIEKKLTAHFADGGITTNKVIAGVIGVSASTVGLWLRVGGKHYKEDFHMLLDRLKPKASAATDQKHRDLAYGRNTKGNAAALNRRASHLLGMTERTESKQEITTNTKDASIDELNEQIKNIEEELASDE